MTDLNALLAKVKAATEGSRELDAEILCAFPSLPYVMTPSERWTGLVEFDHAGSPDSRWAPFLTHSIDSSLSLAERLFPGFEWTRHMDDCKPAADVVEIAWRENEASQWIFVEGKAATTPLAIIAALIEAKLALE